MLLLLLLLGMAETFLRLQVVEAIVVAARGVGGNNVVWSAEYFAYV